MIANKASDKEDKGQTNLQTERKHGRRHFRARVSQHLQLRACPSYTFTRMLHMLARMGYQSERHVRKRLNDPAIAV